MAEEHVEQPEVEEPTASTNAASQEQEQDPEARYRYDESLLIKNKNGTVKRPQKPDESERNLTIDKLKAEIEKRSARIKEIKDTQEQWRSQRNAGQSGNKEIISRLQSLRSEFQSVLRQKQHVREELQQTLKTKDELRSASRQLRDRLPKGVTAETVDAKIAELEYKQQHESGADDKALMKRISELNQAKPLFKEYAAIEANLKTCEDSRAEIQQRLQQFDAILTDVKNREEAERATLEASRSKQTENEPNFAELNAEKKECWDIIQALRAKMDEIRKAFSEKYTEYIKQDRNYNNYIRAKKRQEYEERQKARAEREAAENGGGPEANEKEATEKVEAYASEVFTLDQLLTYLRKLAPNDDKNVAQEAKKEVVVPQGMKLLKKDDDDSFMSVSRKPKGKKGGSASNAAADSPATKAPEPAKKKLNHGLDTLKTFMQFGIEVPQTTTELPATIEKAEAKKQYYLELRRTGKKPEPPAPEPASVPEPEPEPPVAEDAAQPTETAVETAAETAPAPATQEPTPHESASQAAIETVTPAETASAQPATRSVPKDGLGVDLSVDQQTQQVTMHLTVGA